MIVFAAALAAGYLIVRAPHHRVVAPTVFLLAINPLIGLAVGAALVGWTRGRRIVRERDAISERRSEEILAADLVASGVEVGVSFDEAISVASGFVSTQVSSEMGRMSRIGHRVSGTDDDGSIIQAMFRMSRRSEVTGAPLAPRLRSLSESERAQDAADRQVRMQRLPVKLLFPLAFLILPGFLLVAVAPTFVGGISKLSL
jgi:hypothetical protein